MNPLKPSGSLEEEDRNKFMEELETARIASSLESRRQQVIIRRTQWVPEARKEVAARKEFKKTMEIFPDLVWEAILERVGDSKDKAVMSNMTEMWWKLCKGDRVTFLFQDVFSILHTNGYLSATNDMLNCRLVCTKWKRSIEDYLQSSESKTDLDFLDPQPLPMLELIFPYEIHLIPMQEIELFNLQPGLSTHQFSRSAHFKYSGENPFTSRKIILGTPAPVVHNVTPMFWGSAEQILEAWGRELWELTLCFDRGMSANVLSSEIYDKLIHCRAVRYLRIVCNEYGELPKDSSKSPVGLQMQRFRENGQYIYGQVLRLIEAQPLPDLPYLKSLQTTFVPPPIIQAMIKKYGSILETLCCGAFEAKPSDYVEGRALPQLREFKSFYYAQDNEEDPLTFKADWPNLKELTLLFENVREGNILGLFKSLNRFSSQGLRKLTLHLHKEDGAMTKLTKSLIKQLSLELPELEVMTLSVCRIDLSSIDFLLPLAKLKELNLIYVKHFKSIEKMFWGETGASKKTPDQTIATAPRQELIKLSDYINRLYESNIWRVFPELKFVRIGVIKICTENFERLLYPDKRSGGRSTEQLRLLQVRDVSGMRWVAEDGVQTKRKVYTREGYELHLKASN